MLPQDLGNLPPQNAPLGISAYTPQNINRAEIALRCAPFTVKLFANMAVQGVNLRGIYGSEGVKNGYLRESLSLIMVENALLWLIQVGILRREVDGQGITDSFRLTPMGHLLLEKWQDQSQFPKPTLSDRLQNLWAQIQLSRFF